MGTDGGWRSRRYWLVLSTPFDLADVAPVRVVKHINKSVQVKLIRNIKHLS